MQPAWRPFRVPTRDFVEGELRLNGERAGYPKHRCDEIKEVEVHGGVRIGIACYASRLSSHTQGTKEREQEGQTKIRGRSNEGLRKGECSANCSTVLRAFGLSDVLNGTRECQAHYVLVISDHLLLSTV